MLQKTRRYLQMSCSYFKYAVVVSVTYLLIKEYRLVFCIVSPCIKHSQTCKQGEAEVVTKDQLLWISSAEKWAVSDSEKTHYTFQPCAHTEPVKSQPRRDFSHFMIILKPQHNCFMEMISKWVDKSLSIILLWSKSSHILFGCWGF